MDIQTIYNSGVLVRNNILERGRGHKSSQLFLNDLVISFIKQCTDYHDNVGELPFVYKEKQIHSTLLPAISKIADAVFVEVPVLRKESERVGWVDYWVWHDSTIFIMELKHCWSSIASNGLRKEANVNWLKAINQVGDIKKNEVSNLTFNGKKLIKIALMIIPYFQSSQNKCNLKYYEKDECLSVFNNHLNQLDEKPSCSYLWLLHKRLQERFEYNNRFECYPCVGVIMKIDNDLY